MANEIVIRTELRFSKTGASDGITSAFSATFTGTEYQKGRQIVGTTEEALVLGNATAGGWCMLKNLDATNFVSLKPASGATPLVKIPAGGSAGPFVIHSSASAPFVQADTANVEIEVLILEA